MSVEPGIDVFISTGRYRRLIRERVAVLTHQGAVSRGLDYTLDILVSKGVKPVLVLIPEHGFWGAAPAGSEGLGEDVIHGVPASSVYRRSPRDVAKMLQGCDVLVVDLQDVGVRFYTYLTELRKVLEAASIAGVEVVVLDRPNPLGGLRVEGPLLRKGMESYVAPYATPVIHGMTLGELAAMISSEEGLGLEPLVVPMKGWRRSMLFPDTGLEWVPPSPALPHFDNAFTYPATALFEGTNVSEGRGTYTPFRVFGAPWLRPRDVASFLQPFIHGVKLREVAFIPRFGKYSGRMCRGLYLHVVDRRAVGLFELGLRLVEATYRLHRDFEWREVGGRSFFDMLVGDPEARRAVEGGWVSEYLASLDDEVREFEERRKPFLIYS